jgi:hypothetical protein
MGIWGIAGRMRFRLWVQHREISWISQIRPAAKNGTPNLVAQIWLFHLKPMARIQHLSVWIPA